MALPTADTSVRLAAIDVGSNSIHMVVAQADSDGAITTLWRMKEMVGLGRASFPSRRLTKDAMDRAIVALGRFKQAAQQRQAEKVIAVATSAIREAANGGEFIERAKRELKLYVRVVSAREEARLIYLAVRHAMPLRDRPHFIMDIGGGSVEFIVGDERKAHVLESRKLGAARMTAQYVKTDPISKENLKRLGAHYDTELTPLCRTIIAAKPVKAIGTSGTLENLSAMCGTAHVDEDGTQRHYIERPRFEKMLAGLIKSNSEERSRIRGLDDPRRDQVLAGALLVGEVFKRLNLKRIEMCPLALREGILLDYLQRHIPDMAVRREVPDPRRRSVLDLARRCDWHQTHSEQVARLTLELFDECRALHHLGPIDRELIEYAALLHDIGWHIGRKGHHKHSKYLIEHGALRNFANEEVYVIANIARYHRKSIPKMGHPSYAKLSKASRKTVDVGAALLRIADGLDRSHGSVVQQVKCRLADDRVRCKLLVKSDAELELWAASQKRELFEKSFKRQLEMSVAE